MVPTSINKERDAMNHDAMLKELDELYIEYNDTTEFGDYTIKIEHDDMNEESPRDWDNLGKMICWHGNYNLGDYKDNNYKNPDNFMHSLSGLYEDELTDYLEQDQIDKCYEVAHQKNIILPLYIYDHSGITMRTTGFSCPWDSGQVGYIYISLEDVRKEYGWKRITKKRWAQIEKYLTGEVETYDMYLTGSVYGFTIEKGEDEEHVDSCWGFYGYYTDDNGYMLSVIKNAIKYDIEHTPQQTDISFPEPLQMEMMA